MRCISLRRSTLGRNWSRSTSGSPKQRGRAVQTSRRSHSRTEGAVTTRLNQFEQFLVLFEKLKTVAGEPRRLASFYAESSAIRDAVKNIQDFTGRSGQLERRAILWGPKRFSQVPRGFEKAWNEYKTQ